MAQAVDFINVIETGLETSPFSKALAGLRANEARYFKNKYNQEFIVTPATKSKEALNWVTNILKEERNITIESKPLETASLLVEGIKRNGNSNRVGKIQICKTKIKTCRNNTWFILCD